MAMLSVVVPVFNTEEYLDECICSILNQGYKDLEIVLVDDGSTDKSGDICEKYKIKDSRVKLVHTSNQGMILARREGVLLSTSPYITFVDSDDFIDKCAYEYAVDYMERDVDVICFGIRRWRSKEDVNNQLPYFEEKIYDRYEIEKTIYPNLMWPIGQWIDPSLCTKLIKRELLVEQYERIKDLNINYMEDAVTLYPVIKRVESLGVVNRIYYNHRQRCDMTHKPYIEDCDFYDKAYRMYAYMKKEFVQIPIVMEQVEKYYARGVNSKRLEQTKWKIKKDRVREISSYPTLIVYGAGQIGREAIPYLSSLGINKFILAVTNSSSEEYLLGNKIYSISEVVCNKEEALVLLAVSDEKQGEIRKTLSWLGYQRIINLV